jgi:Domain of unknown function (DUF4167)
MSDELRTKPAASSAGRSNRWVRNSARSGLRHSNNAQKDYERYLALARAETQIGNSVGAENYYQHAEHYFRSMRSDSEGT